MPRGLEDALAQEALHSSHNEATMLVGSAHPRLSSRQHHWLATAFPDPANSAAPSSPPKQPGGLADNHGPAGTGKPKARPPAPPTPEQNEDDFITGPEDFSSQSAIETIPGGPGRPAGAIEDSGGEGTFNWILMGLSFAMISLGFGYEHCIYLKKKYGAAQGPEADQKRSSRASAARSSGRPIPAGSGSPSAAGS
eukprot:TRINITY_DN36196_c0_g1_i1.p1 TRINITY_DN36196_c0_g1~~TRINITY_DN36196_c0_g1_i1.p1  ORF type:complete len:195 (-),score=35.57 TRINITY_DN36196_c0_g1_i1:59-643(-)